jgi:putative ABC transport system permease protein
MIGFKLKILKRSFYRDKQFVVLNMLGLILAFTSILFILSWIKFEKSFDQFYENSSRIYRFTVEDANSSNQRHFARVNRPWLKNLAGYFPEVEELVRLAPGRNSSIIIGQEKFYSKEVFSTDSNFFSVFNIDLVEGAQADVLKAPRSAVINESTACKYFPNTDPIGKEIKWSHQQSVEFLSFTVTGVMPDFPVKSHFHPKILLSYDNPLEYDNWYYLYFLLKKNVEVESVE